MPKYYVKTKSYKMVLSSGDMLGAAKKAFSQWIKKYENNFKPGSVTTVSEIGFNDEDKRNRQQDKMYDTKTLIKLQRNP